MTAAQTPAARRNQIPRGIMYMVASTVMFAGVNAIVKLEVALYPVGEVAFFRALFAFATVCAVILPRTGIAVLRTRRYREHLQRGVSQFGSMTCMFMAFRVLPLASAIAIGFAAPLFTTLLSIVVLKEKVGIHRWAALIAGFIGVLVVTHPGAGTLTTGALFALANAVLISSVAVAIRRMSATESTETLTIYQMSVITICAALLLPFGFVPAAWQDMLGLAVAGIGNGIAQYWWTRSLSLAPPSAVVPFNYLSLVWAAMLGFAIWGDVPTPAAVGFGDRRRVGALYPVARDLAAPAANGRAAGDRADPAGHRRPLNRGINDCDAQQKAHYCGSTWRITEAVLSLLDLDRLRTVPLQRDPFDFVVADNFIRPDQLPEIIADFPRLGRHGSFPLPTTGCGAAFARLAAELEGPELCRAIEEKFAIDLAGRPTMITLRGYGNGKDGRIHTDSATKLITLLLYMNPVWKEPAGRLRLLRSAADLDDYVAEIPPVAGMMVAFRRAENSFHGHYPHVGERRSIQLNWVIDASVVRRELGRHHWSARLKTLNPFG